MMIGVCQTWDLTKIATICKIKGACHGYHVSHSSVGCCQLGGGASFCTYTLFQAQWPEGKEALLFSLLPPPIAGTRWHILCRCEEATSRICLECVTMSLDIVSLFGDLAASPSLLPGDWQDGRMSRSLSLSPLICPFKQRLCHWCHQSCAFHKQ